jgi:hypothetical protein
VAQNSLHLSVLQYTDSPRIPFGIVSVQRPAIQLSGIDQFWLKADS